MVSRMFFISLAILLLCGCDKELAEKSYGSPSSAKILIAGTASPFKNAVISNIVCRLSGANVEIQVAGSGKLQSVRIADYKAVLLITPIQAGKIDPRAEEFIRNSSSDKKIILFYTRGAEGDSPNWKKPELGVDTVSSASITERTDIRADQIVKLILERTGGK